MIDQPPGQDITEDYTEYREYTAASPDDAQFAQRSGMTPAAQPARPWDAPAPPSADALDLHVQDIVQQSIALTQLLIAPLSPEQALGQALIAGMRLLPSARELAVYAAQPGRPGELLRLAAVTRRAAADESELDLAPRSARTLGFGSAIDQHVLQEGRTVDAPGATYAPLRVAFPEAERPLGALVVRWESRGPTRTDAHADRRRLDLLVPVCATLIKRREQTAGQRRIVESLVLLPRLQRASPAPRHLAEDVVAPLPPTVEELEVLRAAAEALRRLLDGHRAVILTPAPEGILRVDSDVADTDAAADDSACDGTSGGASGVIMNAALTSQVLGALGGGDVTVIGGRSPLAQPFSLLLGNGAAHPTPAAHSFILFAVRVATRIAALIVVADPAVQPGTAELAVARAEVAALGGTLHAIRLGKSAAAEDAARDAFISHIVHELRSPLTAVKGYAQLILRQARRLSVPHPMTQAIEAIEEQATRMGDMISEMHDAVRIRRGDLELHLEPVALVPLVAHAVEQQRKLFPEHEIELEVSGEPLEGEWDPQRIEQVVTALVNNGARYTPGGGILRVQVARQDTGGQDTGATPMALVCVQDRGIGIAESDQARIFEYLYRSPETRRRRLSGLGLGLFVSRTLIERMGGRLWLEDTQTTDSSTDSSSGSTFCFTLPLSPMI